MENLAPILLLRGLPAEARPKHGGGGPKPPLVPITNDLLQSMKRQLMDAENLVASVSPLTGDSFPLSIKLREKALAKTKRPKKLFADAGIEISASASTGQLIAEVDQTSMRELKAAFDSPTTKEQIFEVSTIEEFSVWHPFLNTATEFDTLKSKEVPFLVAKDEQRPLRIELFPWISTETPLSTGEFLLDYLQDSGFTLLARKGTPQRQSLYFHVDQNAESTALVQIMGIRSATVAPEYGALPNISSQSIRILDPGTIASIDSPVPDLRPVGVFDSGVAAGSLSPWVVNSHQYDLGSDRDESHGTFVGGLIAASRALNNDTRFPSDTASIVDAQVLPSGSITENILLDRIEEVLIAEGEDGPRVWNCSFASTSALNPVAYSPIAQAMDELSTQYNVLFVQAAGNYVDPPGRLWPPSKALNDGIASPADAVRSLTVGSLSHLGGVVAAGKPSSYSRRGPSFGGQQKPDLVHWSGDFSSYGSLNGHGVRSLSPNGNIAESVGTSFATPIVAATAANVWHQIESNAGTGSASPELVKGLLSHSAALSRSYSEDVERRYYGAGVPSSSVEILGSAPDTFTTVHEVNLSRGVDWLRSPFPVPHCLITDQGKLRAEIIMTVSYAPKIDPAFGDECVRTSVAASFGPLSPGAKGPKIKGIVPPDNDLGQHDWESAQIEQGKWSPITTHRRIYRQGTQGGMEWGLKLSLLERTDGELQDEQKVFVILTFRGIEPELPVYQDGIAAVNEYNYASVKLANRNELKVQSSF